MARPKGSMILEIILLCASTLLFALGVFTAAGFFPQYVPRLSMLVWPGVFAADCAFRLFSSRRPKGPSFPAFALVIAAVAALSAAVWLLLGQPFQPQDIISLSLVLLAVAMAAVVRFNKKTPTPPDGDSPNP